MSSDVAFSENRSISVKNCHTLYQGEKLIAYYNGVSCHLHAHKRIKELGFTYKGKKKQGTIILKSKKSFQAK